MTNTLVAPRHFVLRGGIIINGDTNYPQFPTSGDTPIVVGATNTTNKVAADVVSSPTGSGITRTPSNTVASVQAAINAALPGDIILIPNGSYNGTISISVSGTLANPIVIRPLNAGQVTWTGGRWTITGSYVQIADITRTDTGGTAFDLFQITGATAQYNRISKCNFSSCGSTDGASSVGLIKIDGDPTWTGYSDGFSTAPHPIQIDRHITIDQNIFTTVKNCCLWVQHGNQHIYFTHNTITGPHGIASGETEAVKFGYGVGWYETSNSWIAFNTVTNWAGTPYVMGLKMSNINVIGNVIGSGRFEVRAARRCRVIGNVWQDGDLHWGGDNHEIAKNYIKVTHGTGGFGPMMIYVTSGDPPYVGVTTDWFYVAGTGSNVHDNLLINATTPGDPTYQGLATLMFYAYKSTYSTRPSTNIFANNHLWGNDTWANIADMGYGANTSSTIAANTWNNNILSAPTTPTNVLGGSNTVSDSDIDVYPSAPTSIAMSTLDVAYA